MYLVYDLSILNRNKQKQKCLKIIIKMEVIDLLQGA